MKGDGLAEAMTRYTNLKAMYEQKQAETEQFVGPLNQCKVQMRRREKQLHEANVAKEADKKTIKDLEATNARDLPTLKENYGERVSDPAGRSLEELHTVSGTALCERLRIAHPPSLAGPRARSVGLALPRAPRRLCTLAPDVLPSERSLRALSDPPRARVVARPCRKCRTFVAASRKRRKNTAARTCTS